MADLLLIGAGFCVALLLGLAGWALVIVAALVAVGLKVVLS